MRRILASVLLLAASVAATPSAHADEASRRAKAERLLVLTKSDAMMDQMLSQMSTAIKSSAATQAASLHLTAEQQVYLDKFNNRVADIIKTSLSMDSLKPIIVKVYVDTYTDEELDGIIAFYSSPAGQAFVTKGPQLMQRSIQLMQQQMAGLEPQLEQASKDLTDDLARSQPKK
jgi:hypothetical protein